MAVWMKCLAWYWAYSSGHGRDEVVIYAWPVLSKVKVIT